MSLRYSLMLMHWLAGSLLSCPLVLFNERHEVSGNVLVIGQVCRKLGGAHVPIEQPALPHPAGTIIAHIELGGEFLPLFASEYFGIALPSLVRELPLICERLRLGASDGGTASDSIGRPINSLQAQA